MFFDHHNENAHGMCSLMPIPGLVSRQESKIMVLSYDENRKNENHQ
jgi:hypothetical protein